MKKCNSTTCRQTNPQSFNNFTGNSKFKDKLEPKCKSCKKDYYLTNKEKIAKKGIIYREKNKEAHLERAKSYYRENKKKVHERTKKRYKEDIIYRLSHRLRSRLRNVLRTKGFRKNYKALEIIGCSLEQLKLHIEAQFKPGMTWENYGHNTWHIDHIDPIGLAKNPEEVKKLSHYTNLQPLWAEENLKKSKKKLTKAEE